MRWAKICLYDSHDCVPLFPHITGTTWACL
eukprot:SAG11_NODE_24299_length_375_cov_1.108696_1_plen_29_part_01